ncbi:MAG: TonB-dependent receptor [Thiomicrorhabdus sp.]|nr:TonB-dependent receptor [Thiomicrorhabdus sp.]
MSFKLTPLSSAIFACLVASSVTSYANTTLLSPVIITADLREETEQNLPTSVEVFTQSELQDRGAVHFDDVLLKTANVNVSGQSSRARHIQIRGIGQRDEYTGAPNSSVGFVIDDMDFSGIAMAANLFDVKQVEVLKGPQNIRFGQSAIAGLIHIQSNDPTADQEGMVEATVGQDNLRELGFVSSGAFNDQENSPQYRVALFKHNSDGFRRNATLDRNDTNARDEQTFRAKLRFFPSPDAQVDVSLLHADLNNGYDAWSRDNQFTTYSNQPGKDAQLSNAVSVKASLKANPNYALIATTSFVNSDMLYSYDEDWTSASNGTYLNNKHRRTLSQELRWVSTPQSQIAESTDWLFGLYASKLDERNRTEYWDNSDSDFTLLKTAAFTQFDYHLSPKSTITFGARAEKNNSEFNNSANEDYSPEETLWGANLTYRYIANPNYMAFAGVTRGYKAGGFNAGQPSTTADSYLRYDAETLINYEIGLKTHFPSLGLKANITAFYMDRIDPQFDGYTYDPSSFTNWVFYTENFDSAQNYGVEADVNWQVTPQFTAYGSLGLLQTSVSGTPLNSGFTLDGREQAHAPAYQINLGATYRASNGVYAQADVTALDQFYFDNVHDAKSENYRIINARIGYEGKDYEIYVWGKNLTDETYATRGYHFDFNAYTNPSTYVRLGDPRQLGVTTRVYF